MPTKRLQAKWHLDGNTGFRLRLVKTDTERFVRHNHEYFELFLVLSGKAVHTVAPDAGTERESPLARGDLVFMRPDDVHDYAKHDEAFSFVNLAFSRETFDALRDYLGEGFPADALYHADYPPCVHLADAETNSLYYRLMSLADTSISSDGAARARARTLLVDLFTRYFPTFDSRGTEIPFWLEHAYEAMKQPKNFMAGKERLFALAGKTREHTTRCLKKYYGVTPSEYVTDLRLSYAAGLLRSSNFGVTDICFECGFANVSWFYTTFEKKFGVTPMEYRKG